MLLCVAGGSNSGFNRERSREGARCNTQSSLLRNNGNKQIMVDERCSMTSTAVSVSSGLVATQDTTCLDPRASRSVHNKHEKSVAHRAKVIVVRNEDAGPYANNGETCATTTTFKSNVVNGARSTNTILVRYKPSSKLSQSSEDEFKSEYLSKSNSSQHSSISSSASSTSGDSTSSKKDKISVSAWAQIMELEGYRSPAIGLDTAPKKNSENICGDESSEGSAFGCNDSLKCCSDCNQKRYFAEMSVSENSYLSDDKNDNYNTSISVNRDLDSTVEDYNTPLSDASHKPKSKISRNIDESYNPSSNVWLGPKSENHDTICVNYPKHASASSSSGSDKISEDSLTLHCSVPSERNYIKVAQKIKSPMYRSESSRVPKAVHHEKKSRRKTLPDRNIQFMDGNSRVDNNTNSKQSGVDIDPNASWGRYNSKAMRDSVKKVAQKYAEVYFKQQSRVKLDSLHELKSGQLTRYALPYNNRDHVHSSSKLHYPPSNLYCSRMTSVPSHLHEVMLDPEPLFTNSHKWHYSVPKTTHHDHNTQIKKSHKIKETKKTDVFQKQTRLDQCPSPLVKENYFESESVISNSDGCSSISSQGNNSSGESESLYCDKRDLCMPENDHGVCKDCRTCKLKYCKSSQSFVSKVRNSTINTDSCANNLYFSSQMHSLKSKLCAKCVQSAESGLPSKQPSLRSSKCHKNHLSFPSSPGICSSVSDLKRLPITFSELDSAENVLQHFSYKDDCSSKLNSTSKNCTRLTAREMKELVHGNNSPLPSDKISNVGVANKVTNWIQRQKDKRKPVFFIGDTPTFFSIKGSDMPEKSVNRKSKRSLSLSSVREGKIGENYKGLEESSFNLSSIRYSPNDDNDLEHKHLCIKRTSSTCSNRGSSLTKIRQGSPVRDKKESVAKKFDDTNKIDRYIAPCKDKAISKRQNSNTLNLNKHPIVNNSDCANLESRNSSEFYLQKAAGEDINSYDFSRNDECKEQKGKFESEQLSLNESNCLSFENSNQNLDSLITSKNERSSFSKKLLNIKQLSRALSLHSLKKKTKESLNEPDTIKPNAELTPYTQFSKWTRTSKRKSGNSKYGSLRKSISYCELALRESGISEKSQTQVVSHTEVKSASKSSARTSVLLNNSIFCCSTILKRSVSLYANFPLNRCLEYSVEDHKSEFLARLCVSRLCSRNGIPPFFKQLKNKRISDKMKDNSGSEKILSPDIPEYGISLQIPVIVLLNFTGSDANILRKRAASTSDYSPKSKSIQRPVSVTDYLTLENSPCTKVPDGQNDLTRTASDTTSSEEQQKNLTSLDQIWRANPVKLCRVHSRLLMCRHKGRYRLRRSISQPVELEMTGSVHNLRESTHGSADHDNFQKGCLSSDDEASSESDIYHSYCCSPTRRSNTCWELSGDGTMYAEALWDHETIDPEELPFQAGDIIEVTDTSDQDWWWGSKDGHGGWFPSAFVRLYVSHRTPSLHFNGQQSDGIQIPYSPCKVSMNNLSCEQVRANIVQEIVATEKDYVKHLKDVVEGYLKQVQRRPDMFSKERIETVFGNIKEIYTFQSQFLKQLEDCLDKDAPHLSQIGNVFLKHKEEFKMYSQYCNNHPLAVSELQELYCDSQYIHFFEACRLLQEMIDISLDGFLLTPIQRICKYPLQLAELLKFTDSNHPDHVPVTNALAAMKEVAELVNERKRRMECLERIAEWQNSIEGWEGPDVLDTSSILIHCGEVTRVSSSWSRDIYLFIFDHLLIYCKKDLLKRHTYAYKGRLNLDNCDIVDVEDGKDSQFAVNVKNAWKIFCKDKDKWYLFYAKTAPEKDQWLRAFKAERQRVIDDEKQAFVVTEEAKKSARLAVHNKQKPKRPRAKFTKGRRCHPDVAVTELLLDSPSAKARSGSLPSNIHPELAIMAGAKLGPTRKKGSGWFHFGSGKKPKS